MLKTPIRMFAAFSATLFFSLPSFALDTRMIGTWESHVTKKEGTWRLLWVQGGSGLYHSVVSGPGYVPEEWGLFSTKDGKFDVKARSGRLDNGTYAFDNAEQMTLVGKTGEKTVWHRLSDADRYPVGQPWPNIPAPQAVPVIPPGVPVMWGHIKEDEKPSASNNWGYGDTDPNPDPSVPYVLDEDPQFNPKYPPKPGQPIYRYDSHAKLVPVGVGGPNGEINESKLPPLLQWGGITGGFLKTGGLKPGWFQHDHPAGSKPTILDFKGH